MGTPEDHKRDALQMGQCGILSALFVRIVQTVSAISIIWATAVVLGAFAPDIKQSQFIWVSSLLLAEGLRMVAMSNVSLLFTRQLVTHVGPPVERIRVKKDLQYLLAVAGGIALAVLQVAAAIAAVVLSAVQLSRAPIEGGDNRNLVFGIRVFYGLMIAECGLSILFLSVQCLFVVFSRKRPMWLKYYFEVFEQTLQNGLTSPTIGGFVEFGMRSLAACHESAMTANNIYNWHKDFVSYLGQARDGMEVVLFYLNEGSRYEREAAANLIGFWQGNEICFLNEDLMHALFANVGPGKVGRAIALSLSAVVQKRREVMGLISDEQLVSVAVRLNTCMVQEKSMKDYCYLRCAVAIVDALEGKDSKRQGFTCRIRRDYVCLAADNGKNQSVIAWAVLLLLLIGEENEALERRAKAETSVEGQYMRPEDKECLKRISKEVEARRSIC